MNQEQLTAQQEIINQEMLLVQKAVNRLFNTDDGKLVLAHLMNEFVFKSPHAPGVSTIDMAHATGKADLIKAFYLTAINNV